MSREVASAELNTPLPKRESTAILVESAQKLAQLEFYELQIKRVNREIAALCLEYGDAARMTAVSPFILRKECERAKIAISLSATDPKKIGYIDIMGTINYGDRRQLTGKGLIRSTDLGRAEMNGWRPTGRHDVTPGTVEVEK